MFLFGCCSCLSWLSYKPAILSKPLLTKPSITPVIIRSTTKTGSYSEFNKEALKAHINTLGVDIADIGTRYSEAITIKGYEDADQSGTFLLFDKGDIFVNDVIQSDKYFKGLPANGQQQVMDYMNSDTYNNQLIITKDFYR